MLKSLLFGAALMVVVVVAVTAAEPVRSADPVTLDAYRRLPYCRLTPDGQRLAEQPCRRPPTLSAVARRAASALTLPPPSSSSSSPSSPPQALEPGHASSPGLVSSSTPATPAAPLPSAPPASSARVPPLVPPSVQPLNQCGIAGCRSANGVLYQPGAGDIVLDPSGRMCTRSGQWVHCP
ncbi:MAG: hypothetical protein K2X55_03460 [Burkholderiaceae bacterium]|nr:hypothetical protein [Burkholderiaceae bacterium]